MNTNISKQSVTYTPRLQEYLQLTPQLKTLDVSFQFKVVTKPGLSPFKFITTEFGGTTEFTFQKCFTKKICENIIIQCSNNGPAYTQGKMHVFLYCYDVKTLIIREIVMTLSEDSASWNIDVRSFNQKNYPLKSYVFIPVS